MAIPDLFSITLPVLNFIKDGREYSGQELIEYFEKEFDLTEEEKQRFVPSGTQRVFVNNLAWARVELKMGGLIESPKRGFVKITQRGLEVLKSNPVRVDRKFLQQFPEYRSKIQVQPREEEIESEQVTQKTPDELLEIGYQRIRQGLENELLDRLKSTSSQFFERLVLDLLVVMGYGGANIDYATVLGKVGDEGIDGIIKEDALGLDTIYVQAKRWKETTIGRPEIQKFAGALQGQRAKKGVFISTSDYTKEAIEYVSKIDTKIVLISGSELARLMIDKGVGVSVKQTYEIKKIDSDYFSEE